MTEDIGNAAGVIWRFLNQQTEPVNLLTLKKGVTISTTLLTMGLGWLAKEGKLDITMSDESYSYRISIKRQS